MNDVVVAPGSDGIAAEDRVVRAADTDFEAARIIDACRAHAIELAVVGPEGPLADGMVDELVAAGITTFGPSQDKSAGSRVTEASITTSTAPSIITTTTAGTTYTRGLIRRPPDIPSREITDESLFWNRREFLKAAGFGAAAVSGLFPLPACRYGGDERLSQGEEKLTPWEDVTGYNNYYEFGTEKDEPERVQISEPEPGPSTTEDRPAKPESERVSSP